MKRSGTAELPLHGGRVPAWLAARMTELGTAVVEFVVRESGPSELPTRLSDPFWFQALGCVMGMDWHSSGITTSVMGLLRRALDAARLGHTDKVEGFRRLDRWTRAVQEQGEPLADFAKVVTRERQIAAELGGRTVWDDRRGKRKRQMELF